jgi:hypothetical protein
MKIFVLNQVKLLQNLNDGGLSRAVIFGKRRHDRRLLREKAALEIKL